MRALFVFLLLGFYLLLPAQIDEKHPLEPLDVFSLQMAHSPAIQPGGEHIAYLRQRFDLKSDRAIQQIWIADKNGERNRPLTDLNTSYRNLVWSPDGQQLAFVRSEDGTHYLHLYVVKTGHQQEIAKFSESPGDLVWSPGGDLLAFRMFCPSEKAPLLSGLPKAPSGADWADEPTVITQTRYRSDGRSGFLPSGHQQIFVIHANGGAARQLTYENYDHGSPQWSPDGQHLVFAAQMESDVDLRPQRAQLYRINLKNRRMEQLTDEVYHFSLQYVSQGGDFLCLAYVDKELGYQRNALFVIDGSSGDLRKISWERDRQAELARWTDSGEALIVQYTDRGMGALDLVHLKGGHRTVVSDLGGTSFGRPYAGGDFALGGDNSIAYTRSTPHQPANLYYKSIESGALPTRLTNCNEIFLQGIQLGVVEQVNFTSSYDEQKLEGWVIYPPNYEKGKSYPTILEIHGGPYAAYGPHFSAELQLMAAAGYLVFYMNPRGSTSYGESFAAYINNNYPSEDYDDLMSGIDELIDRGVADEEQLFIAGGSGGGVLTAWSIGKTDRFRAAAVVKPVINWYSFVLTADAYSHFVRNWFDEKPWDQPEAFLERSPLSLVGKVKTPTLLMTGEEDYRTPMSETEQYYGALRIQGVESALVRIPGASHGIAKRPSNLLRKTAIILSWFDQHAGAE